MPKKQSLTKILAVSENSQDDPTTKFLSNKYSRKLKSTY